MKINLNKLNGWQKLYLFVCLLWLMFSIGIFSFLPSRYILQQLSQPKKYVVVDTKEQRQNWIIVDVDDDKWMLPDTMSEGQVQHIIVAHYHPMKSAIKDIAKIWLIPCMLFFIFEFGLLWVIKGFKNK